MRKASSEPEFKAWRERRLTGLPILCSAAIPVGVGMGLPSVWILGLAGTVAAGIQLRLLERQRDPAEEGIGGAPEGRAEDGPVSGASRH